MAFFGIEVAEVELGDGNFQLVLIAGGKHEFTGLEETYMPSIQSITAQHLIEVIGQAAKRIVFIVPGIWPPVALALANAWPRPGAVQVNAIRPSLITCLNANSPPRKLVFPKAQI